MHAANFLLSTVQTTAIHLQDFSYPSFIFSSLQIMQYALIPLFPNIISDSMYTPTTSCLQCTAPHRNPLYITLPFIKPCFSLSEELSKIFCTFRLKQEKKKPSISQYITQARRMYILLPAGTAFISLLSSCVFFYKYFSPFSAFTTDFFLKFAYQDSILTLVQSSELHAF